MTATLVLDSNLLRTVFVDSTQPPTHMGYVTSTKLRELCSPPLPPIVRV